MTSPMKIVFYVLHGDWGKVENPLVRETREMCSREPSGATGGSIRQTTKGALAAEKEMLLQAHSRMS